MQIGKWAIPVQNAVTSRSDKDVSVAEDYKRLEEELIRVREHIAIAGRVVDYYAFVLRLTQPNHSNGMFDIRWWITHGRRMPRLVRWKHKEGGARAYPKPVKRIDEWMVDLAAVPEMRPRLWRLLKLWPRVRDLWVSVRRLLYFGLHPDDLGRLSAERRERELVVETAKIHKEALDVLVARGVIVETRMGLDEVMGADYGEVRKLMNLQGMQRVLARPERLTKGSKAGR